MRKVVTLRARSALPEARAFQAAPVAHLPACRAPFVLGETPEARLTINYHATIAAIG